MQKSKTLLAASAILLALAPRAWALPVEWKGSWSVDGTDTPRLLQEPLPGQITTTATLPVEGSDVPIELTGGATANGLSLDALYVDGIGFVGLLENVPTKTKHSVSLRATADVQSGAVVVDARYSVDGKEVKHETWRAASSLELVDVEVGQKPLSGDFDAKTAGPLVAKFRVHRGAIPVRARIEVEPGHPYASFYASSTIVESSLGTLEPGDHVFSWDGRDSTQAKRIALGGPYRVVLEPTFATSPATTSASDQGLPAIATATPTPPSPSSTSAVTACFAVAAPRLEMICSDWPANYGNVTRPRWNEGALLDRSAAFLTRESDGKPGLSFETARVLSSSLTAAGYMKQSACTVLDTHGNIDSVWFYTGDPSKPWDAATAPGDDGITGQYLSAGDLKDMHFAVALICDGGIPDGKGHSFVSSLRDAGCDVAIGFSATIDVGEGRNFRDIFLRLISQGSPVEKAARDGVRMTFSAEHPQPTHFLFLKTGTRQPTDAEMNALIDKERNTPADPKVNYGIKSLASSIVVERGTGIGADESMWPPRHGNSTN